MSSNASNQSDDDRSQPSDKDVSPALYEEAQKLESLLNQGIDPSERDLENSARDEDDELQNELTRLRQSEALLRRELEIFEQKSSEERGSSEDSEDAKIPASGSADVCDLLDKSYESTQAELDQQPSLVSAVSMGSGDMEDKEEAPLPRHARTPSEGTVPPPLPQATEMPASSTPKSLTTSESKRRLPMRNKAPKTPVEASEAVKQAVGRQSSELSKRNVSRQSSGLSSGNVSRQSSELSDTPAQAKTPAFFADLPATPAAVASAGTGDTGVPANTTTSTPTPDATTTTKKARRFPRWPPTSPAESVDSSPEKEQQTPVGAVAAVGAATVAGAAAAATTLATGTMPSPSPSTPATPAAATPVTPAADGATQDIPEETSVDSRQSTPKRKSPSIPIAPIAMQVAAANESPDRSSVQELVDVFESLTPLKGSTEEEDDAALINKTASKAETLVAGNYPESMDDAKPSRILFAPIASDEEEPLIKAQDTPADTENPYEGDAWLQKNAEVPPPTTPLPDVDSRDSGSKMLMPRKPRRSVLWIYVLICLLLTIPAVITLGVLLPDDNDRGGTPSPGTGDTLRPTQLPSESPSVLPSSAETTGSTIPSVTSPSSTPSTGGTTSGPTESEVTSSPSGQPTIATPVPSAVGTSMRPTSTGSSERPTLVPISDAPSLVPASFAPTDGPTSSPTALPSPLPSSQPLIPTVNPTLFEFLVANSPDDGEALQDESSPQYAAYLWLSGNENLDDYDDDQRLQRFALATIYNSMDGPNWTAQTGWLSDSSECEWFSRDNRNPCGLDGSLHRLLLFFNNLRGTIPREISLLTMLREINLEGGPNPGIVGSIPSDVGLLTDLRRLVLRFNILTGVVPMNELAGLSALEQVDLSQNELSGRLVFPFSSWSRLTTLDLAENSLTGNLPPSFGAMTALRRLFLQSNQLTGPLPSQLGALTQLRFLDAFDNSFSSIPTDIGHMRELERLSLHSNALAGSLPTEIGMLSALQTFDVRENQLTSAIPSELGGLQSLRDSLDLSHNAFTGPVPSALGKINGRLHELLLQHNELTGTIPAAFQTFDQLTLLRFDGNLISGVAEEGECSRAHWLG